ncbi:MAG: PHP domain-containing protein, partial [Chlorobi bacterium]|nr:PHP domain-containing protein [Chlorobiota bacterium]
MFLIFDTETTGLPKNYNAPLTDFDNWPRLVQLAWQIHNEKGELEDVKNFIVRPEGFDIPRGAEKIHGITTEYALKEGQPLEFVLEEFNKTLKEVKVIVGHNIEFDLNILGAEFLRMKMDTPLFDVKAVDTKEASTDYCALPGGRGGKYKWPNLDELHRKLFNESFDAAHNASADVQATARCFLELVRIGVIDAGMLAVEEKLLETFREANPEPFRAIGLTVEPYHEEHEEKESTSPNEKPLTDLGDVVFTHLHVHTQYSILDGLSEISALLAKAKKDGMEAVAITDHGNMFGVKR